MIPDSFQAGVGARSAETLVSFTSVIDTRSGRYSFFSCISIVYFAAFAVNRL